MQVNLQNACIRKRKKVAPSEQVSVRWCEGHKEWFIKKDLMVPMGIEQEIHLYTFFYVLLSLIIVKVFNTLA